MMPKTLVSLTSHSSLLEQQEGEKHGAPANPHSPRGGVGVGYYGLHYLIYSSL